MKLKDSKVLETVEREREREKYILNLKSEKGSITVFVLTTMLFMLIVIFISYMMLMNKNSAQIRQIEQVQAEYESSNNINDEMDEIYNEIVDKEYQTGLSISLYKETGEKYSVNEWTNQNLRVVVNYSGGAPDSELKFFIDGKEVEYEDRYEITDNCTIRAEYGNKKQEVKVTRIDKELPTVGITPNGGVNYVMPTDGKAKIRANLNASDSKSGVDTLKYAWSNSNTTEPTDWKDFKNGEFVEKTDCEKGNYYLWTNVKDKAGNRAEEIKVSNVFTVGDNTLDANKIKLTPDVTEWTNGNVKVTVEYGANLTQNRKAGYGEANTANATSVTVEKNGTVYAEATDIEGNKVTASLDIKNIDKTKPTIDSITNPSNGNWTKDDVKITLNGTDNESGIKEFQWYENGAWTTRELTTNGNTGTITYTVERDTSIRYRVVDKAGNISDEKTTTLKIDKGLPTVTITPNGGTNYVMPTSGKATIRATLNASDSKSGLNILQYAWSNSNTTEPAAWTDFENGTAVEKTDCTKGNYYLWTNVKDKAGNRAEEIKVSNVFTVGDNTLDANKIKLTPDITEWTNGNVKVTVEYGANLTQNRKAGYGEANTANATSVTVEKNGTVYAEATDIVGNKVTASLEIKNIDKTKPTITSITNPTNGNWSKDDVKITLNGTDNESGIKEFQWYENGAWTTRALTTSGNTGTITYTVDRNASIRYRVVDKAGNISDEKTTTIKIDKTAPTNTSVEVKNITTTGYDVYVYGVKDTGSGVNRVQFPTWTESNGQDDLVTDWTSNSKCTGVKQSDGTTWVYHVNTSEHNNEYGKYITDVYLYDNLGNRSSGKRATADVKGVEVTFNYGDGKTEKVTKGAGSKIGTLPTASKTGYTFNGWFTQASGGTKITADTVVPSSNVTYYAQYSINSYYVDVNLYVDGTSYGSGGYNDRIYVGLRVGGVDKGYVEDYYTKHNYGTKWEVYGLKIDGVSVAYTASGTVGTSSVNVKVECFTMTIKVNNTSYGSVSSSELIIPKGKTYSTSGSTLTISDGRKVTASVKNATGYTTKFSSWSSTSGTVNAKTTVTATFTRTPNTYTVTYDNNFYGNNLWTDTNLTSRYSAAGTTPTSKANVSDTSVMNGQQIKFVMPAGTSGGPYYSTPAKLTVGKTYTWSVYVKASSNKTLNIGSEQGGTKKVNVTTSWQKITHTFTAQDTQYRAFVFYLSGSTWTSGDQLYVHSLEIMEGSPSKTTQNKTYGTALGTLPTASRAGYTFAGWYTAPTGGSKIATTTTVPAANTTYYAHWTANSYTVTYNYSENGGASATKTSAKVVKGTSIDLSPTATKSGYTFVGWNTNKDAKEKLSSLTMGTNNVTLYAIYSKTITGTFYYWNGSKQVSTTKSATVYNKTTSGSITAPTLANASKDGVTYTQRGWSTSNTGNATVNLNSGASVTLSSNTTYYGLYQASITATFYYHGGTDQFAATQSSTTASGTRYMNSSGAYVQGGITVPSAVTGSTGYYGTKYKGVASAVNSSTAATVNTANTKYYAFYDVGLTYYYYNGSAHTSSSTTRRARSNGSTYVCTVDSKPTPSAYDGASFKWWSYDASQIGESYKREPNATGVTALYAVYEKSVTATFYYNSGDAYSATQTSTTAKGTKNYVSKSGGINTYNGSISIPSAVTGSTGYYGTKYKGVSTATNSSTAATVNTANTKYYAYYDVRITYYYYNGSAHTSSTSTRRARSNGSTYVCTVDSTPKPSNYDSATFKWWSYDATKASTDYKREPNATAMTSLYAVYQRTITATFNYYSGSAATKTTASGTRSYVSKSGGVNTYQGNITIPSAVSSSKGPQSTTYSHVATSKTSTSGATPTTATGTYYAVYKKTVTATKKYYNNQTATASGTAWGYYDGAYANASINLGSTSQSGYTFRGWSTSNAANASITVASGGNASIINNTTYYASYTYTVTATYRYNNTSTANKATAYMGYTGGKVGAKPTVAASPSKTGYTFRGWSTSSAYNGSVATPGTITGDTTYYASFSKTVTLTYNGQSGTGVPAKQTGTVYMDYKNAVTGAKITISSQKPTRSGYAFVKWNDKTDGSGTGYSHSGSITISDNKTIYAIWFGSTTPSGVTVKEGTQVSFSVTGTNVSKYQWYKATSSTGTGTAISGATGSTYTISASSVTTSLNNTYYYCVVTNKFNTSSTITTGRAKLVVTSLKGGTSKYLAKGQSLTLTPTKGGGAGTINWTTSNSNGVSLSATQGNSVTIKGLQAGTYTIKATENAGGASTSYTINVTELTVKNNTATVLEGNKVTLTKPTASSNSGTITYSTTSSAITVNSTTGEVTGVNAGAEKATATVTAKENKGGATCSYTVTVKVWNGEGTSSSPYQIGSLRDINKLKEKVAKVSTGGTAYRYTSKYFKQTSNINLNNTSVMIGKVVERNETEGFNGTYDGNNKEIQNLSISEKNGSNVGFFRILGPSGVIKNVVLASGNVKITNDDGVSTAFNATLLGENYGTIENCTNKIPITLEGYVDAFGGMIGINHTNAIVRNCINYGNLTKISKTVDNGGNIGGVIGNSSGVIENCENHGKISAAAVNTGGITGQNRGTTRGCTNYGDIIGNTNFDIPTIGGIAAWNHYDSKDVVLENCVNYGNINVPNAIQVGGISGSNENATIRGCTNYGEIISGEWRVGGISGIVTEGALLEKSANYGYIEADHTNGGIVGNTEGANNIIRLCVNYGNVLGTGTESDDYDVGGIVAYVGSGTTVENCYNKDAAVRGRDSVGGIVGANNGTISNCYNTGNSTSHSSGTNIGGIVGINQATGTINNSYAQSDKDAKVVGTNWGTLKNVSFKSYSDMLGTGFVNVLGTGNWKKGATTPILTWQANEQYTGEIENGVYMLYTSLAPTSKVMDVTNGATTDGANVQLYDMNYSNAQKFKITKTGKQGVYNIINVNANKSLDVSGAGTANGTNLQIYTTNNSEAQLWKFIDYKNGYYAIQSLLGNYIHLNNGQTANGTNIHMWNDASSTNKNCQWMLKKAIE